MRSSSNWVVYFTVSDLNFLSTFFSVMRSSRLLCLIFHVHNPLKTRVSRASDYPQADAEISYSRPRPLSYTSITIHYLMIASFDAMYSGASSVNRPEIKNVITFGD